MLQSNQRSAVAALDAARSVVARLDVARHPDDVAADVIESWSAVETALRSLLGGSSLGGQALVSEVRQRGLLDYAHAHALLGFLAARDRVSRTDYHPTDTDVDAARAGFQAIEAALGVGIGADTATYPTVRVSGAGAGIPPLPPPPATPPRSSAPSTPPGTTTRPDAYVPPEPLTTSRRGPGLMVMLALAVLLLAAIGYWAYAGRRTALDQGVDAFTKGDRVAARRDFEQAAADQPKDALPHVYLARMARQDGDLSRAFNELKTAVTLDPQNELAQREMGQYLLQANQPGQAVKWFERALRLNGNDRAAQGWMACALQRQGSADLAARFFQRAGNGDWTACQQAGAPMPGGAVPPGALPPAPVPRP